jgi:hypothetical protein
MIIADPGRQPGPVDGVADQARLLVALQLGGAVQELRPRDERRPSALVLVSRAPSCSTGPAGRGVILDG